MKRKYKEFPKLLFCFVLGLVLSPHNVVGQNVIYDLAPQTSEFSIVRHYHDDIDITYSCYLLDDNCFNYIDRYNNVYYKADLDLNLRVSDFRIYNDFVYFCGSYLDKEIIGWFKIPTMFFSGGAINYAIFPTGMPAYPESYGIDDIVTLDKIKVFERNGDLHLVILGTGQHYYNNTYSWHSALVDVWTNDMAIWNFKYTMDYFDTNSYDDLTVTDNYVVVSGRFLNLNNHLATCVYYYMLPTIPGYSIFDVFSLSNPRYMPRQWTNPSIVWTTNRIRIADMGADSFATVCYAYDHDNNPVVAVTYYQYPVSSPFARYMFTPYTTLQYWDVVYNRHKGSLYMQGAFELARLGQPFSNLEIYKTPDQIKWVSIDTLDARGNAVLSGSTQGTVNSKMLWKFEENPDNCVELSTWDIWKVGDDRISDSKEQYVYGRNMSITNLYPIVTTHSLFIRCN